MDKIIEFSIGDDKYYAVPQNKVSKEKLEKFLDLTPITLPVVRSIGNKLVFYDMDNKKNIGQEIPKVIIYAELISKDDAERSQQKSSFASRMIEMFKDRIPENG